MSLGLSVQDLIALYVAISLVAVASGIAVVWGMLQAQRLPAVTVLFFVTAILASVTGFFVPSAMVMPAQIVGGISLIVLATALLALYVFDLKHFWRWIYAVAALLALYLNVFMLVVQGFQKVPFLHALAPNGDAPAFIVAQTLVLSLFAWLGYLAVRRFYPDSSIVPLDYSGAHLVIRASTPAEHRRARIVAKEPRTVKWIEKYTRPGDIAYDIGANVGAVSLIFAHKVGAKGRVFSFEPAFSSFAALCQNAALNDFSGRIVPVPVLLNDAGGIFCFKYRSTEVGESRHQMLKAKDFKSPSTRFRQLMTAISLDAFRAATAIPAPNIIKLDVDGAESAILKGAQETLREPRCRAIIAEVADDQVADITNMLSLLGFKAKSSWDRRIRNPFIRHGYYLFHRR